MIRRIAFAFLFISNSAVAGVVGYAVCEYQHLKKDYEDLRIIARNNLMELEQSKDTTRACTASLADVKERLYGPADFVRTSNPMLAAGK